MAECSLPSGPGKGPGCVMVVEGTSCHLSDTQNLSEWISHSLPECGPSLLCFGKTEVLLQPPETKFETKLPFPNVCGSQKKKKKAEQGKTKQNRMAQGLGPAPCSEWRGHFLSDGWEPTLMVSPKSHSPSICPSCTFPREATDRAFQSYCWKWRYPCSHSATLRPACGPRQDSVSLQPSTLTPAPLLLRMPCLLPGGLTVTQAELRGPGLSRPPGFAPWLLPYCLGDLGQVLASLSLCLLVGKMERMRVTACAP